MIISHKNCKMFRYLSLSLILFATIGQAVPDYQVAGADPYAVGALEVGVFPCPVPQDIHPCVCTVDQYDRLNLDCSNVTSEEQFAQVFQADFPVKEFFEFKIDHNDALKTFRGVFNGVTFRSIDVRYTQLELVSVYALEGSMDSLYNVRFDYGHLDEDTFPLHLEDYKNLTGLYLDNQEFTWLPVIESSTVSSAFFFNNSIQKVTSGAFKSASYVQLSSNEMETVESSTFQLRNAQTTILLADNRIKDVMPGAFILPHDTDRLTVHLDLTNNQLTTLNETAYGNIFPYMVYFEVQGNPLQCGCDIAWILLNSTYLDKLDDECTCADGEKVIDLDPTYYEKIC